jgi:hypothetical protein
MAQIETPMGAYGLRLSGLENSAHLLIPAHSDWPDLALDSKVGEGVLTEDRVTEDAADLVLLTGGDVRMDRDPLRAVYTVPRPLGAEELVHPYLAVAATVAAYWLGRESFHAGAIVVGQEAWALVGDRGAGKSSTLAWLALQGHQVLCDDVLVVSGRNVLAGPRAVDLRGEAARELGTGERLGLIGGRERWRLELPAVQPVVPLRGWIFLDWGGEISMRALPPRDRLIHLTRHRSVRLPPRDPAALLDLAALPAWELRRPKDWVALRSATDALLAAID